MGHTQWLAPISPVNGEGRARRKGGSSKQRKTHQSLVSTLMPICVDVPMPC